MTDKDMPQKAAMVKWMAYGFILAPAFNLLVGSVGGSLNGVEIPGAIIGNFRPIEVLEQFYIFLAGYCLLEQKKSRWMLAILLIFSTVGLNLWTVLDVTSSDVLRSAAHVRLYFSIFLSACVAMILYYARFPYLDRRQGWSGPVEKRFDIHLPVRIGESPEADGTTESLSASGCRVRLNKPWQPEVPKRFVEVQIPEYSDAKIMAQIVGQQDQVLRLKFRDFQSIKKKDFKVWVQKMNAAAEAGNIKFSLNSSEKSQ